MIADRLSLIKLAQKSSGACMHIQSEQVAMQDVPQSIVYKQVCHASHYLGHRERQFLTS